MVCKGNCVDDSQNGYHCTKRGEKCYEQSCVSSCEDGICAKNTYCHIDDKVCLLPCESDKNCAGGYKCSNGHCLKPCRDDSQCSSREQYCHK